MCASGHAWLVMPLFWIGREIDRERVVRIQEGGAPIFARLNAAVDGFGGIEAHALDAKFGSPARLLS